jgi:hypothetical protein
MGEIADWQLEQNEEQMFRETFGVFYCDPKEKWPQLIKPQKHFTRSNFRWKTMNGITKSLDEIDNIHLVNIIHYIQKPEQSERYSKQLLKFLQEELKRREKHGNIKSKGMIRGI